MSDTTRSRSETLKEGILTATNEAAALLALGEPGAAGAATRLEAAHKLAAELKTLSQRMGSEEGYKDAVQMLAIIEGLQSKLRPRDDKTA